MPRHRSKVPLAVQAAKGSWVAPLLALAVSTFGSGQIQGDSAREVAIVLLGAVSVLAMLGVVMAGIALYGIREHGTHGILIPAIIGLLLSLGVIYLFGATLWAVRNPKPAAPISSPPPPPSTAVNVVRFQS